MDTDFLDWALADFSGYVAADELYDGPFCMLSAVDNRCYKRILYDVLGKFHDQRKVDNSVLGQTSALRHSPLWRSRDSGLGFNRPSPPVRALLTAM